MLDVLLFAVWVSVSVTICDVSYFGLKEDGTDRSNSDLKPKFTGSLRSFYKYGTQVVQRAGNCIQGEAKNVECNFCTCYSGHWICTRLHCGPNTEKMALKDYLCKRCMKWINPYRCDDIESFMVPSQMVCYEMGGLGPFNDRKQKRKNK